MRIILKRLVKPMIIFIALLCLAFLVYFLSGSSHSADVFKVYSSISSTGNTNIPKATRFLSSYILSSGDNGILLRMGMDEDDVDYLTLDPDIVDTGIGGGGNAPTSGDFTDCAKAICLKFTNSSGNYDYSQNVGSNGSIDFNGLSVTTTHRDCSCLVSALRYLMGIDSNWVHRNSVTFSTMASTGATTYGDVQVGDVLWRSNHVAMVVKIEGSTVYIADAGSTSNIQKTAENGYAYTAQTSEPLSAHNSFVKVVR